jgi:hypothetical protein
VVVKDFIKDKWMVDLMLKVIIVQEETVVFKMVVEDLMPLISTQTGKKKFANFLDPMVDVNLVVRVDLDMSWFKVAKATQKEKTKKLLAVIKEANKTTTTMVMAMVKIKEVVIIVTTQVVAIAAMAIVITMVATVEKKDVVVVRNFFLIFKLLIIFISIFISFLVENFQLFN